MRRRILSSGGSAPFAPDDVADLLAWFDASDETTITDTAGAVTGWADKANSNDIISPFPAGSGSPTTGTRTLNGLNVLDYDGVDDSMGNSFELLVAPRTIFAVAQSDTVHVGDIVSDADGTAISDYIRIVDVNGVIRFAIRDDSGADDLQLNSTTSLASAGIVTVTNTGTVGVLRMNGTQEATASFTSSPANSRFSIGRLNRSSPIQPYNGIIAEVLIYSRVLDSSEISDVETYLANKWGITL